MNPDLSFEKRKLIGRNSDDNGNYNTSPDNAPRKFLN